MNEIEEIPPEKYIAEYMRGCKQDFAGFRREDLKDNLPGFLRNLILSMMIDYKDQTPIRNRGKDLIKVKIEPHFAGEYRLEYDGKYVTLFGRDKGYVCFKFNENDPDEYDEMVLVPCLTEIRNAQPVIREVTTTHIVIDLQLIKHD